MFFMIILLLISFTSVISDKSTKGLILPIIVSNVCLLNGLDDTFKPGCWLTHYLLFKFTDATLGNIYIISDIKSNNNGSMAS